MVDSVGFGVQPDTTLVGTFGPGLPDVQRSLNWVHLATRFPGACAHQCAGVRAFPAERIRGGDHPRRSLRKERSSHGVASEALTMAGPSSAIDQAGEWFWNFLKKELAPYPGRAWVVGRMTISATIVMVLVMTFRIPGGFQGAIFTLLISRENPTETFLSGFRTMLAYLIGTALHSRQHLDVD